MEVIELELDSKAWNPSTSFNRTMQIRILKQFRLNNTLNFSFWASFKYYFLNTDIFLYSAFLETVGAVHSINIYKSLSLFSFLLIFSPQIVLFQICPVGWNSASLLGSIFFGIHPLIYLISLWSLPVPLTLRSFKDEPNTFSSVNTP